jgi:hypothetical protein
MELTKGDNLFAENPVKNKCVFVKQMSTSRLGDIDTSIRKSTMRLFVDGYYVQEGYDLAEDIIPVLESMRGEYTYSTEEYDVKQVYINDFPYLVQDGSHNSIIITFTIIYHRR